jgi:two-component sensor histidine kinase
VSAALVLAGDRAALMVDEAHHRFFNGLQTIVSATNGIMRDVHDPAVRKRLAALQNQVVLLAEINRHLAGPFGPEVVSDLALVRLCTALAASFDRCETAVSITVTGTLQCPDHCRTMLLLVGELVTNALKHSDRGQVLCICINLLATDRHCRLDVCSNTANRGAAARPRIAAALAEATGGTLSTTVDAGRFRVSVVLPLD